MIRRLSQASHEGKEGELSNHADHHWGLKKQRISSNSLGPRKTQTGDEGSGAGHLKHHFYGFYF
jgi:hypothetical protein